MGSKVNDDVIKAMETADADDEPRPRTPGYSLESSNFLEDLLNVPLDMMDFSNDDVDILQESSTIDQNESRDADSAAAASTNHNALNDSTTTAVTNQRKASNDSAATTTNQKKRESNDSTTTTSQKESRDSASTKNRRAASAMTNEKQSRNLTSTNQKKTSTSSRDTSAFKVASTFLKEPKPEPMDEEPEPDPVECSGGIQNDDAAEEIVTPPKAECLVCRYGGEKYGHPDIRSLTLYETKLIRRRKDLERVILYQPLIVVEKTSLTQLQLIKREISDDQAIPDSSSKKKNDKKGRSDNDNVDTIVTLKQIKKEIVDDEYRDESVVKKSTADTNSQKSKDYKAAKKPALLEHPRASTSSSNKKPSLLGAPPPPAKKSSTKQPLIADSPQFASAISKTTTFKPPANKKPPLLPGPPAGGSGSTNKKPASTTQSPPSTTVSTNSVLTNAISSASSPRNDDTVTISSTTAAGSSSSVISTDTVVKEKTVDKESAKSAAEHSASSRTVKNSKLQNLSDRLKGGSKQPATNKESNNNEKTNGTDNSSGGTKSGTATASASNEENAPAGGGFMGVLDLKTANLSNFKIKKLDPSAKRAGKKPVIRASMPKSDDYISPLDKIMSETNKFARSTLFSSSNNNNRPRFGGDNVGDNKNSRNSSHSNDQDKMRQSMLGPTSSSNKDNRPPRLSDFNKDRPVPPNFLDRDSYTRNHSSSNIPALTSNNSTNNDQWSSSNPQNSSTDDFWSRQTSSSRDNNNDCDLLRAVKNFGHPNSLDIYPSDGRNSINSMPSPSGSVSSSIGGGGGIGGQSSSLEPFPKRQRLVGGDDDVVNRTISPNIPPPPPPRRQSPALPGQQRQSSPPAQRHSQASSSTSSGPTSRPTLLGPNPSETFLTHKLATIENDLLKSVAAGSSTTSNLMSVDFNNLLTGSGHQLGDLLDDLLRKTRNSALLGDNLPKNMVVDQQPGNTAGGNFPPRRPTLLLEPLVSDPQRPRGPRTPPSMTSLLAADPKRPVLLPGADPFAFLLKGTTVSSIPNSAILGSPSQSQLADNNLIGPAAGSSNTRSMSNNVPMTSSASVSAPSSSRDSFDLGRLCDELCDLDDSILQGILLTTTQKMSTPGQLVLDMSTSQEIGQLKLIFETLLAEQASVLYDDREKRRQVEMLLPILDAMKCLDSPYMQAELMAPIREFAQQLIELLFKKT